MSFVSRFAPAALLALPLSALAEIAPEPPMETAPAWALWAFAVATVALIGVYVWFTQRASRKEDSQGK